MKVDVQVDSDRSTGSRRKSTSAGMMLINGTVVNTGREHQHTLSTAEAENNEVITEPQRASECGR